MRFDLLRFAHLVAEMDMRAPEYRRGSEDRRLYEECHHRDENSCLKYHTFGSIVITPRQSKLERIIRS